MSIIQRQICSMCLFVVMFFLYCSRILKHYRTYFLVVDKQPDEIRCNWHLILWLVVEEKLRCRLFMAFFLTLSLAFFLTSSPVMATTQMQCVGYSYMLALLLYVRTLPDRTAFYGAANTLRQNWFNVWYGHLRFLCKRFYNFCLSFFVANLRRMEMELSPYAWLNDYGHQPVFS